MRILMLGNSLTAANDLPQMVSRMAAAEVVAHTRGGARLSEHLNPATRMGAMTLTALEQDRFDVVVCQEASTNPLRFRESYLRSIRALDELARSHGAVCVIFATWALAEGARPLKNLGMSPSEMRRRLAFVFEEAAEATGSVVADVGAAFWAAPERRRLLAADGVHPSMEGTRLAAGVISKTLRSLAERLP